MISPLFIGINPNKYLISVCLSHLNDFLIYVEKRFRFTVDSRRVARRSQTKSTLFAPSPTLERRSRRLEKSEESRRKRTCFRFRGPCRGAQIALFSANADWRRREREARRASERLELQKVAAQAAYCRALHNGNDFLSATAFLSSLDRHSANRLMEKFQFFTFGETIADRFVYCT